MSGDVTANDDVLNIFNYVTFVAYAPMLKVGYVQPVCPDFLCLV